MRYTTHVDIAIVAEALLDDFQAAMLSDVPKDGEGLTVFIAYHTSRQGPIPGTCELACTLPCSLLPSGFCVNVALPLRSRVLPSDSGTMHLFFRPVLIANQRSCTSISECKTS